MPEVFHATSKWVDGDRGGQGLVQRKVVSQLLGLEENPVVSPQTRLGAAAVYLPPSLGPPIRIVRNG